MVHIQLSTGFFSISVLLTYYNEHCFHGSESLQIAMHTILFVLCFTHVQLCFYNHIKKWGGGGCHFLNVYAHMSTKNVR